MELPTKKIKSETPLDRANILLYAPPKFGKCLKGDTVLYQPESGRPITIRELVENKAGDIFTMKEAGVIAQQRPTAYLTNEPAQLFRLTTQTGRNIEATANHPLLTREGWKPLHELGVGDRVAVVAEYPSLFGSSATDDELIKIFAYLIADGSIASGSSPSFTKADPEVRFDFEAAVEAKGDECVEFNSNSRDIHSVRVRGKKGCPNNVIAHLKEVGLHGLRSADKFIPDFVFGLKRRKLGLFLNRLFTCDGSIETSGRVSYSSTSFRMVAQVQHLLTRFGIVSIIRERKRNDKPYAAELMISSKDNVITFLDEIGFIGEKAVKAEVVRSALYSIRSSETQLDRVGTVLFDRVMSVEPTVVEKVYDLTIENSHNFVANDFVVHNSTFGSQFPNVLFLATEPGLNQIECFKLDIRSWEDMREAYTLLKKGEHDFKTIVVDTLDNAFQLCARETCDKFGVVHENEVPYGSASGQINNNFYRFLMMLTNLPYTVVLISHEQQKEVEVGGNKIKKAVPSLSTKNTEKITGLVDVILYGQLVKDAGGGDDGYKRVLMTRPCTWHEAGDRTGYLPDRLPLVGSKFVEAYTKGYQAVVAADKHAPATKQQPKTTK